MQNPEMENDPNKITQTVQNGVLIVKKRQNDPDEVLFYNTDYFKRIGFPEIEVSLVPVTVDKSHMKGGYYKEPEKLTFPFRHFVFLIQKEKYEKEAQSEEEEQEEPEKIKPAENTFENPAYGVFTKLGKYGSNVSNNFRFNFFEKTTAKKEDTSTEQKITGTSEPEPETETKTEENKESEEPETEDKEPAEQEKETQYFWVLRIPIIESEEIVPLGKYEKMEMRLEQILKDEKVDKSLGKSKEVEEIMVNGRVLRLCKSVKEWSPINYKEVNNKELKGAMMSKYV